MAKNTTKFSRQPGETTSGTTAILDLSDLEDELFPDLEHGNSNKSAIGKFVTGFKDSFLENFSSTKIVRRFSENALPKGFSRLMGSYDELMSDVREIKNDFESTNASDILYLNQKVSRLLPNVQEYIPENLYKNISDRLQDNIEHYEYKTEEQVTNIRKKRSPEEERAEVNEAYIKEALDHSTLVAKDIYNRSERSQAKRDARQSITDGLKAKASAQRFDFLSKSLSLSVDSLTRLANYNEQVDYNLQKKSLEVQLRSYLEVKDLNKNFRESLKLHDEAYKALVRNTALPDHKKKHFDELNSIGKPTSRLREALVGSTAESLSNYLFGYRGKLKGNIKKSVGSRLGEIVQAIRTGDSMVGMEDLKNLWDDRYGIAGSSAGEYAANFIQDRMIPSIGRQLRPELEKFGDTYLGGTQHQTSFILDNIPALLRKFADGPRESGLLGGLRNQARDFLNPLLPTFSRRTKVEQGGFGNINEMAAFNEMTQRSIVDVIPGYLSRILHEVRILRTGDDSTDREVYDITSGKFTGFKSSSKNLMDRLITPGDINMVSGAMGQLLAAIDPNQQLSDKAQDALVTKLLRQSGLNKAFDPESFLDMSNMEGVDRETFEEIRDYFKSEYSFTDKGKMIGSSENYKKRQQTAVLFNELRDSISDPSEMIFKLIESGNTELLRELEILYSRGGQDYLNYEKIWEVLASDSSKKAKDSRESISLWGRFGHQEDDNKELRDSIRSGKETLNKASRFGSKVTRRFGLGDLPTFDTSVPLDIYSRNRPNETLIKGEDLLSGNHRDVKSKKPVKSIKDITGPVTNAEGIIVITQMDFDRGLFEGERFGFYDDKGSNDESESETTTRSENLKERFRRRHGRNFGDIRGKANKLKQRFEDYLGGGHDDVTKEDNEPKNKFSPNIVSSIINSTSDYLKGLSSPNVNLPQVDLKNELDGLKESIKVPFNKYDVDFDVKSLASGINAKLTNAIENAKDRFSDVYSRNNRNPLIKESDFVNGTLFDSKTGNPITSVHDITGPVIDANGTVIISNVDIAKGLYTQKGVKLDVKPTKVDPLSASELSNFKANVKVDNLQGSQIDLDNLDWYAVGTFEPVITAVKLKAGEYFGEDGKPITSVNDIVGAVYDRSGNQVVTEDDFNKGLFNKRNQKKIEPGSKLLNKASDAMSFIDKFFKTDTTTLINQGIAKVITAGVGFTAKLLNKAGIPRDAYLPGQPEPILTVTKLKAGEYYNIDGKVIESLINHKGPIYDTEGNLLLDDDEIKTLLNIDGSKHALAKNYGFFGSTKRSLRRYLTWYGTKYLPGALKRSGQAYKWLGSKIPGVRNLIDQGEIAKRRLAGDFTDIGKPNYDAYLPDKELPVLTRKNLAEGKYLHSNGEPIVNFNDVRGPILDLDGNVIVEKHELTELRNPNGSKHIIARNNGKFAKVTRVLTSPFRMVGRGIGKGVGLLGKGLRSAVGATLGRLPLVGRFFKNKKTTASIELNKMQRDGFEVSTEATLLAQILDAIRAQAPEEIRKGSWKDQANRAKEAIKNKVTGDKSEKGLDGLTKSLFGGLKKGGAGLLGLLGLGNKDETTKEEDGYGIGDGIRDAALGRAALGGKGIFGNAGKLLKRGGRLAGRLALPAAAAYMGYNALTADSFGEGAKSAAIGAGLLAAPKLLSMATPLLAKGTALAAGAVTGLAGLISAPVLIGGALVAGGGWLAYNHYKAKQRIKGDFKQLRLLQYGFTSTKEKAKMIDFEDELETFVTKGTNSRLTITAHGLNKLLKLLKINPNNKKDAPKVAALIEFINGRFKQIFTAYFNALSDLGLKHIKLNDIDEKLKDEEKSELLDLVLNKLSEVDMLDTVPNPFNYKKKLTVDKKSVDKQVEKIKKSLKRVKGEPIDLKTATPVAAGLTLNKSFKETEESETIKEPGFFSKVSDRLFSVAKKAAPLIVPGLGLINALKESKSPRITKDTFKYNNVPSLVAIRLRAYGAEKIDEASVYSLLAAETETLKLLSIGQDNKVSVGHNLELILNNVKFYMGSKSDNINFNEWFVDRFLPVVKSYYVACKSFGLDPNKDRNIKDKKKALLIAERIFNVETEHGISIWDTVNIHKERLQNFEIKDLAKIELTKLRKSAESILATDGLTENEQKSFLERGKEAISSTLNYIGGTIKSGSDWLKKTFSKVGDVVRNVGSKIVRFFGFDNDEPMGTNIEDISFTTGNGGSWTRIPRPTIDKNDSAAIITLEAVSNMTGVPTETLFVIARQESEFEASAKASTGSATGWFQFIDSTWDSTLRKYGGKYGIPNDTPNRQLRLDPRINALMGAELIKENANSLKSVIKDRNVNTVDIYIAHFFGINQAIKFLGSNPNSSSVTIFPSEARTNRSVFYKGSKARTIGELYQWFVEVVKRHLSHFKPGVSNTGSNPNETKSFRMVDNLDDTSTTGDYKNLLEFSQRGFTGNIVDLARESVATELHYRSGRPATTGSPGPVTYGAIGSDVSVFSFTEGNGGDWSKIPKPSANRSAKAARPTLEYVSKMIGVPAIILHTFAGMESNFDYLVKASTSSATGWFQFINATWDEMIRKYGSTYGLPKDDGNRSLRRDPRINALMGALFLRDNRNILKRYITNREINAVDLYFAHFLGPVTAGRFLSLPPNTPAAPKYPKQAQANKSIFYVKGRARTVAEIYQLFKKKVEAYSATFDNNYKDTQVPATEETKTVEEIDSKDTNDVVGSGEAIDPNALDSDVNDKSLTKAASDSFVGPTNNAGSVGSVGTNISNLPETTEVNQPVDNTADAPRTITNEERMNKVRAESVKSNNIEMTELINVQHKQLAAVLDIRESLMELVKNKVSQKETKIDKSNTPKGEFDTVRARQLMSYDGLFPVR